MKVLSGILDHMLMIYLRQQWLTFQKEDKSINSVLSNLQSAQTIYYYCEKWGDLFVCSNTIIMYNNTQNIIVLYILLQLITVLVIFLTIFTPSTIPLNSKLVILYVVDTVT